MFVYVGLQSLDLRLYLQCFGGRLRLSDFHLILFYIHRRCKAVLSCDSRLLLLFHRRHYTVD